MRSTMARLAQRASFRERMPQSSYYKNAKMSPALERARKAYLVPNLFTGLGIIGFSLTVYAYTIKAVSQDEFEDVPVPDGPAPSAAAPHSSNNMSGGTTAVGVGQESALHKS